MDKSLPILNIQLKMFITSPVLLACIFSALGAQFIKTAVSLVQGKIHSLGELFENMFWKTGGMPSSHSSMVTSLCTTIAFRNGIYSDIFILSFIFFLVVIRDALGVRRSSGLQAKKINEIGKELVDKKIITEYKKIKEVNGHSPMEVISGILFGLLVGLAFSLLK